MGLEDADGMRVGRLMGDRVGIEDVGSKVGSVGSFVGESDVILIS